VTQTYADLFILGASCEVLAVRAEANTPDVEIAILVDILILKSGHILTGGHIENLS
jgi:hypothetical protein